MDQTGKTIIDFTYDLIYPFNNYYMAVYNNEFWGVMNVQTGELVINLNYLKINDYLGEGQFSVKDINYEDQIVDIGDKHQYDIVYNFTDFIVYTKNAKYGIMNHNYEKMTEAEFDSYCGDQKGVIVSRNGLYGEYDFSGNIILPVKYEAIKLATNRDDIFAFVKENGKWGILDNDFNYIIEPKYDNIGSLYSTK